MRPRRDSHGNPGIGRRVGATGLVLVLAMGAASLWRIERAETWWSKQFSSRNPEVARIIGGLERPLVVLPATGFAVGELLSLAYHLDPWVRIWAYRPGTEPVLPEGFGDLVLLVPGEEMRAAAGPEAAIAPIAGTWQWFLVRAADRSPASGGAVPN